MEFQSSFILAAIASLVAACSTSAGERSASEQNGASDDQLIGDATSLIQCAPDGSDAQCPAGHFNVTCKDGSKEVRTQQEILNNQVCSTGFVTDADIGSYATTGTCVTKTCYEDWQHAPGRPDPPIVCTDKTESVTRTYRIVKADEGYALYGPDIVPGAGSSPLPSFGMTLVSKKWTRDHTQGVDTHVHPGADPPHGYESGVIGNGTMTAQVHHINYSWSRWRGYYASYVYSCDALAGARSN